MPPASDILKAADAVVSELNAASLSLAFTSARFYLPRFELTDMDTLHVTVVPQAVLEAREMKALVQYDLSIDVAIQQRFSDDTPVEIDPLMDLVQEIADFFRLRRLTAFTDASWLRTERKTLFDPTHMDELRQFTSVLTLVFRVVR